jgi:hypothetical protein
LLSRRISRENTNYRYAVFKVHTSRVPVGERKRHLPAHAVQCRPAFSIARVGRSLKAQQHEPHSGKPGGEPIGASAESEPGVGPARPSCRCDSRRAPYRDTTDRPHEVDAGDPWGSLRW